MNSLGGTMYGDGEYVVDFSNNGSSLAPLKATVMGGSLGNGYAELTYTLGRKASIGLAAQAIDEIRKAVSR